MPKPCSKPLTPNPFEAFRDPVTGRWMVQYPAVNAADITRSEAYQPANQPGNPLDTTLVPASCFTPAEEAQVARMGKLRRWETSSRTKVA